MVFARPLAQAADENAANVREGKGGAAKGGLQPQANTRRALGDIGNLVGPFNTRCNVGKDNNGVKKATAAAERVAQVPKAGVTTRRAAAAAAAAEVPKVVAQPAAEAQQDEDGVAWGATRARTGRDLRVKDTNVPTTSGTAPVAAKAGRSMSSLLQSRSEAAVAERHVLAPASPMPDIDSADKNDPLAASEYVGDIFSYYRRVEPLYRVAPDYMSKQNDINDKMRAILVDWLVEVHLKFKLMPETLFLTTNLIDRFLELKPVTRKNLQLVGVTAMLIASKYEEIWAPEVRDFVYISDRAYTREQILCMEKLMLNTLRFNLTVPTPYSFMARYLKAASTVDKQTTTYAAYLVELSLPDFSMLKYPYSMVAAAAIFVANKTTNKMPAFPRSLQKHSGFTEQAIRPCAVALATLQRKAGNSSLVAVYKKYSNQKFMEVARLPGPIGILDAPAA
ncbi:hypothetical protein WJX72_008376 [[Myrmecia] bisecta]|uniref:Uncharacterized protein n=1 Tax=[Myrmecia] bisecta TaxID=41462 RepID=A0AAW1QFT2_9CHLO